MNYCKIFILALCFIVINNEDVCSQARSFYKRDVSQIDSVAWEQAKNLNAPNHIKRVKGVYEFDGEEVDPHIVAAFLSLNCPEASIQFERGRSVRNVGWGLFGVGIGGMIFGGSGFTSFGLPQEADYRDVKYLELRGQVKAFSWSLFGVGAACFASSVISLGVGYHKQNTAYKLYNKKCARELTVTPSISENGLGLTLNF